MAPPSAPAPAPIPLPPTTVAATANSILIFSEPAEAGWKRREERAHKLALGTTHELEQIRSGWVGVLLKEEVGVIAHNACIMRNREGGAACMSQQ